MLKPDTWRVVLSYLSQGRSDCNQNDWRHLVSRSIVPEVKQEIIRFYGTDNEPESTYPGLDYANPNHRLRLSSFPFHRQLFQAFDALNLTYDEIYMLCKWHGTKRSKDEYEKRHAFKIVDTTLDDVHPYTRSKVTVIRHDIAVVAEPFSAELTQDAGDVTARDENEAIMDDADHEPEESIVDHVDASDEESEDEVQRSVGVELNQRLLANAEANVQARARGEMVSMDLDWEQWVKEAAEREAAQGATSGLANVLASVAARSGPAISDLALSLSQANATQEAASSAGMEGIVSPEVGETQLTMATPTAGGQ